MNLVWVLPLVSSLSLDKYLKASRAAWLLEGGFYQCAVVSAYVVALVCRVVLAIWSWPGLQVSSSIGLVLLTVYSISQKMNLLYCGICLVGYPVIRVL